MVGEMELKVIGPPWITVTVATAKRVASALDVATTLRLAVVGSVPGAVYFPVSSIEPQPGLQVGSEGYGAVAVGVPCVTSQLTPWLCRSFVSVALNCSCSLVGTVAVPGVRVTTIPESRVNVALPDCLVSAAEVAVMMMERKQACSEALQLCPGSLVRSGTLLGAVNTTVVSVLPLDGMLPVSAVQGFLVEVVD